MSTRVDLIELSGSTLAEVRGEGTRVVVVLHPAYVQQWDLGCRRWSGSGWLQAASIQVDGARLLAGAPAGPLEISEGALAVGGDRFVGVIPAVLDDPGSVRLEVRLAGGERLELEGEGITIGTYGPRTFVEDLSDELAPPAP